MIKIDDFDRTSPYGILLKNVGYIHSPFLKDIAKMGYKQYQYIGILFLYTPEKYFDDVAKMTGNTSTWKTLTNEQKNELTMFDLYARTEDSRDEIQSALALFIYGELTWDNKRKAFLVNKSVDENGKIYVDGFIDRNSFPTVAQLCLQFMGVKEEEPIVENPKFKNEKDRAFYEKYVKRQKEHRNNKPADPDFELSNMISVICTYHNSLNYSNIYELTVAQVQDTFYQLVRKQQIAIKDRNYSVWGGKNYDPKEWFKKMKNDN